MPDFAGFFDNYGTLVVAVYAAFLSTALAVRGWWRARHPLYITLSAAYPEQGRTPEGEFELGSAFLTVRVVNRSANPITVDEFGLGFEVDYRRTHPGILGNVGGSSLQVNTNRVKLSVFDVVEATVPEQVVLGGLYPEPAFMPAHDGLAEGWEGYPPNRIGYVWARDATGRQHRGAVAKLYRELGFESWTQAAPPVLNGVLKAAWYHLCMAIYMNRHLGERGGPLIVNTLHRLRLFPISLPSTN